MRDGWTEWNLNTREMNNVFVTMDYGRLWKNAHNFENGSSDVWMDGLIDYDSIMDTFWQSGSDEVISFIL